MPPETRRKSTGRSLGFEAPLHPFWPILLLLVLQDRDYSAGCYTALAQESPGEQAQLWKRDGKRVKVQQPHKPGGKDKKTSIRRWSTETERCQWQGRADFLGEYPPLQPWEGNALPSRQGIMEGRLLAQQDSHKSSPQQGFPSKLQTRLLTARSQKGRLAWLSKIPGRGGEGAGERQADTQPFGAQLSPPSKGSADRPSLTLSNALSQVRKKNKGEKKQ